MKRKRKRNRNPVIKQLVNCADCGIQLGYRVGNRNYKCNLCTLRNGNIPKCSDCGNSISVNSYHNTGKCYTCYSDNILGSNHPGWKGGPKKCINCNNFLGSHSRSKLCKECWLLKNKEEQKLKYACEMCGKRRSFYAKRCIKCVDKKGAKNPAWKGGKASYNWLWEINRKIVLKRDNYTCQICLKRGRYLNVHHIIFLSNFMATQMEEAHALSNLITLCKGCHNALHNRGKKISIDKTLFS